MSLQGILLGIPESRSISHYWEIDGAVEKYHGEIKEIHSKHNIIFYYKPDDYDQEVVPVV